MDNRAFVIGGVHHNILGIIRSLGKKGLKNSLFAIVVGQRASFLEKSKYINQNNIFYVDSYVRVTDTLFEFRPRNGEPKPVVICCGDTAISKLDAEYDRLSPYFLLPNAKHKQGEITRLLEKNTQVEIAKNVGFNVPETHLYDKRNDNSSFNWKLFPCIVKPLDILLGGKSDICICKDEEELKNTISNDRVKSVIIQPFIDKLFEFQIIGMAMGGV